MLLVDALLGRGVKETPRPQANPPFDYEKFAATMRRSASPEGQHPDYDSLTPDQIEEGLTEVRKIYGIGEFGVQPAPRLGGARFAFLAKTVT